MDIEGLSARVTAVESRVTAVESAMYRDGFLRPALPPAARLGRSSHVTGGALARLWAWLRLPPVRWFRVCARCHERMEVDAHVGILRSGTRLCQGWTGERCLILTARYG